MILCVKERERLDSPSLVEKKSIHYKEAYDAKQVSHIIIYLIFTRGRLLECVIR